MWGAASIFGPTLGGWLTDLHSLHDGWRWCFYVNLPVGIIAIAAIWIEFPYFRPQGVRRVIDWWGVVIAHRVPGSAAAGAHLGDASTAGRRRAWRRCWQSAVAMLVAFLFVETRAAEPLIPLSLFRDPIIRVCSIGGFLLGMGMFGVIIYLPLFMQGVLGVSATRSGSLLTPMMLAAVTGNIFGGQMTSRLGRYKALAIAGSVLIAAGMIVFATMDATTHIHGGASDGAVGNRYGIRAAGVYGGRAERRAAPAHGHGDRVEPVFPLDRQHRGCGDVRQRPVDALQARFQCGRS